MNNRQPTRAVQGFDEHIVIVLPTRNRSQGKPGQSMPIRNLQAKFPHHPVSLCLILQCPPRLQEYHHIPFVTIHPAHAPPIPSTIVATTYAAALANC